MRKWKLLLPGAPAAVALVCVGATALIPQPGITRRNYDRIGPGMSRAEVEAILGPPGTYTTNRMWSGGGPGHDEVKWPSSAPAASAYYGWETDAASVLVRFDTSGRAIGKEFCLPYEYKPGFLDWLRDQWRRWFP